MNVYILNAISVNMNHGEDLALIQQKLDVRRVKSIINGENVISYIGHPDTARVVSSILDYEIPANRGNFSWDQMGPDDKAIIAQYIGPRLPEGATRLPEGAEIQFWSAYPVIGDKLWMMFEACSREGVNL